MNKNFIIYNLETGEILRVGYAPENLINLQNGEGEGILVDTNADSLTQMVVNGQIVDKVTTDILGKSHEELQREKSISLSLACRNAIYTGYKSSALGSVYLYPCNKTDQLNMIASVTDSLNPANDETWQTPFWCADSNGVWAYKIHTAAQIQKAGADGKAHITTQLFKNANLQVQIAAATTQEELDVIVWETDVDNQ
jgi:hypothetical protein